MALCYWQSIIYLFVYSNQFIKTAIWKSSHSIAAPVLQLDSYSNRSGMHYTWMPSQVFIRTWWVIVIPRGPRPPPCWSFEIIHTPHSVGLLWTSDWPVAETCNTQHSQEVDFHARGVIRTRSPRKRVAAVPRLIPCGRQVRRGPIQRSKCIYQCYNVETLRFWWFDFLTWQSLLL